MTYLFDPDKNFMNLSGNILANGVVYFCVPDGTANINTLKTIYTTAARNVQASNPQTLTASGRFPQEVHGTGYYDVVIKTSVGGATIRTLYNVQSGNGPVVNVMDYGATGNGTTDDTAAIQAAIDALGTGGGTVYVPKGVYRTTATVTLDEIGITLRGDGSAGIGIQVAGSAGVVPSGQVTGAATRIYGDFTSGPVVRVTRMDCSLQDMTIDGSTTRKAAALSTNYGVWVERTDTGTGFETARRFYARGVRVCNQPSHGWVLVDELVTSRLDFCIANYCNGHGFVVAGGEFHSRTNKTRPGQVDIWNCLANDVGGHSLLVGSANEATDDDMPYRVNVHNFETFYCAYTPTLCVNNPTPSSMFLSGENHTVANSAIDGRSRYPTVADTHTCLELRGRFFDIVNNRFIDGNPYAIKVVGHTRMSNLTKSVFIRNPYIVNSFQSSGFYDPAVYYSTDAQGVHVECDSVFSIVTNLSSRTAGSFFREINNGTIREDHDSVHTGTNTFTRVVADVVRSSDAEFSMAHNTAAYIDFGAIARGVLLLVANVQNGGVTQVAFRVGDANAFAAVMASSSASPTVTGGTGTLAGTTGVDTHLTLRADTASNRLYIENRTGAARTYHYAIMAANDLTAVAQIVAV